MKLLLPHNWQKDLIDSVDLNNVEGFYGKLNMDLVGGGKPSNTCPFVSRQEFKRQIRKLHDKGMEFTYILNGLCLDNQELSHSTHHQLKKFLGWLQDAGVDALTVSLPYLAGLIKKNFPEFKIGVSTLAEVDTPNKAKFWEDLGVSRITLFQPRVTRNFELIKKIRRAVRCDLQLIANLICLNDCPFTVQHGVLSSHASQGQHFSRGFALDYCVMMCNYLRMNDPVRIIRANWIRPEDTQIYEGLGIDSFKLVTRGTATRHLVRIVKAYKEQNFDGNLLDLLPTPSKSISYGRTNLWWIFRFFFRPELTNIFKLEKIKRIFADISPYVYVDNKKLNGFLIGLQDKKCASRCCDECDWCGKIANDVMKVDARGLERLQKEAAPIIEEVFSGRVNKYF